MAFAPEPDGANNGFSPKIFRLMVEIELKHFWFVARNRTLMDVMRKHFTNPGKVLKMGCGMGFVLPGMRTIFLHARFSGSDFYQGFGLHRAACIAIGSQG